jgi:hypothetical protein
VLWGGETALAVQFSRAEPPVQNELAGHRVHETEPFP